jgi:hypothetical protein
MRFFRLVELLASDAGDRYIDFDDSKLEQGDVIVFGDNDHVVTYDGNGGYVGNSSAQEQVVHGSDYHNIGLTPTHIIKTPSGGNGGYSGGNGSSGGKGAKKERTIMDLFGHLGDMYTNLVPV